MNLNGRGQAALGVGSGPGSVDGRVVASPGGGICFVDDDRVALQTEIGGQWVVIIVRLSDGEVETPAPARGANNLAAGGGRWMAWLAGMGVYGSIVRPAAGLIAAGPDGTLAYCPSYSTGVGVILNAPDGRETPITDGPMVIDRQLQVLGPTSALWLDFHGGLRVFGRAPLRPALTPGRTRLVTVDGEDWLVYQSAIGLVAQRDGAADGYVLEARPITFNHDARAVDGQLVVAWSVTQGEGPGDLRKVTVDRTQPRVPLVAAPITFTFDHPVLPVVFKDPDGQSGAPAEIIVNQTAQGMSRPFFVAEDSLQGPFQGTLLGVYSESALSPQAALQTAATLETRLFLVRDAAGPWAIPSSLPAWAILGRELYWYKAPGARASDPTHPGETLAAAVARWRVEVSALLAAWPGDCAVVAQFYCMGGAPPDEVLTEDEVLAVLGYLSEIVNLSPRVKVIGLFEFLRANGITAHGKLRAALKALLAAAQAAGLAELRPIGVTPAPRPKPAPTPIPPAPHPTPVPAPTPAPTLRQHVKGRSMEIDGKIVVLRGFKGLLLRPDAPNTGIWAHAQPPGWRGGLCDRADSNDAACHHRATKLSSGRYTFTHVQNNGLLGEDAGQYTPSIDQQFYYKPDGNTDAGDLEQWRVYDGNENGALEAQCEHVTDDHHPSGAGKKFFAYPLSVEVVG